MRKWSCVLSVCALVVGVVAGYGVGPAGAASPWNDNFAAATVLPSTETGSVTGSVFDATYQPLEPGSSSHVTAWWRWTAPSSGTYQFDLCGTQFEAWTSVYTGSSVDALTDVGTLDTNCYWGGGEYWLGGTMFTATAGTTYSIQVGAYGAMQDMGDVVLSWYKAGVPGNDSFSSASQLPSDPSGSETGTTRFATKDTAQSADVFLNNSVWWYWDAPASEAPVEYLFDACGTTTDTRLGIYTGSAVSSLVMVAEGDDNCGYMPQATFTATGGQRYYIGVSGYADDNGDQGDFTLHWQAAGAPGNDNLSGATAISGANGTATGNARFATANESGEDLYTPLGYNDSDSVWWWWTAPTPSGPVEFDTCESDFNTTLAVYSGSPGDAVSELSVVAPKAVNSCLGTAIGAMVMFNATAGQTYAIRVASVEGLGVGVTLRWRSGTAPANDNFASASLLDTTFNGTATGSNLFATTEASDPIGGHSVWWKWTAPSTGLVTFDTCGSTLYGTSIMAVTGTSLPATTVASAVTGPCGNDQAFVRFTATAGTTYSIGVKDTDGGMGDLVLRGPAPATVVDLGATVSKGKTTFVFRAAGRPIASQFQCRLDNKKAVWTTCTSGDTLKGTARTVSVHASSNGGTTWGDPVTVTPTR